MKTEILTNRLAVNMMNYTSLERGHTGMIKSFSFEERRIYRRITEYVLQNIRIN